MSTQNTFLIGSDTAGNVQFINVGKSDNSTAIFYELETQEIELGDRSHLKEIQDRMVFSSEDASSSEIQIKQDENSYKVVPVKLTSPVSISEPTKLSFHFFTLKWLGNSATLSPVFNGFYLEKIIDQGLL